MERIASFWEQVNSWAAPLADALGAPIWAVAVFVYGLIAAIMGWLGRRATKRRDASDSARRDVEIADARARDEALKGQLEQQAAVAEQRADAASAQIAGLQDKIDAFIAAQLAVAGASAQADSETAMRAAVEDIAASPNDERRAALFQVLAGDDAGFDTLAELAARDPSAGFWEEIGDLAFLNNTVHAIRAYEEARAIDPDDARVWYQLAGLYSRIGAREDAQAAFNRVIELAEAAGGQPKWMRAALGGLAHLVHIRGDLNAAEELRRRSFAISEEQGDRAGMAVDFSHFGQLARDRDDLDAAADYHARALAIHEQLDDKEGTASALGELGVTANLRGDEQEAEDYFRRALALAEAEGLKENAAYQLGNLARLARTRQEYDDAIGLYERALDLYMDVGNTDGCADVAGGLGIVEMRRGDAAAAEPYLRRAVELYEAVDSTENAALMLANLGLAAQAQDNAEAACEAWARAVSLNDQLGLTEKADEIRGWMEEADCSGPASKVLLKS